MSSDWVRAGFTPAMGSSSITSFGSTISALRHFEELALPAREGAGEVVALGVELEPGEQVLGARFDLPRSWDAPQTNGSSARPKNPSPRWAVAPSFMFSITVSREPATW